MGKVDDRMRYLRRLEAARKAHRHRREVTAFVNTHDDECVMTVETFGYGMTPLATIGVISQLIDNLDKVADQAVDPDATRAMARDLRTQFDRIFAKKVPPRSTMQ